MYICTSYAVIGVVVVSAVFTCIGALGTPETNGAPR